MPEPRGRREGRADQKGDGDRRNNGLTLPKLEEPGEGLRRAEIERAVERRLIELAASGGMTTDRLALELLYMLPPGFRDAYTRVFHEALAGADGGSGARGAAQAETAAVGKARGKGPGGGRRYKKGFTVRSEKALGIKDRADRRLRALGREMIDELEGGERKSLERRTCGICKQFSDKDWRFCPTCGTNLEG